MMRLSLAFLFVLMELTISAQNAAQYNNQASNCQSELAVLQGNKATIETEYDKIIGELKQGLFCSLCNRSKSQIEKGGVNFYQHIKDVKGSVVQAPQAAYDQAFKEYQNKISSWQRDLNSKQQQCENYRSQAQNAYLNEQNKIAEENRQKQQTAQQQAYQRQQELAQKQQEALQQLQAKIEQQQQIETANKIQQQADISQKVNEYVNTQAAENQQRQQVARQIAVQGSEIAKDILSNSPDITRIKGNNLSNSSIFEVVPSYEEILNTTPVSTPLLQNLQKDISDLFKNASNKLTAKWDRFLDAMPACLKCGWDNEIIKELRNDYLPAKIKEHLKEESGIEEHPRLQGLFLAAEKMYPVYNIGESVNDLTGRIGNAIENFEGDSEVNNQQLQEGIENVQTTIYFGNSNNGSLFKLNQAFKSWFDCIKKIK